MAIGVDNAPSTNNEFHWVWGYDSANSKLRSLATDPNGFLSTGDQQIAGVVDDGSSSGVVKQKLSQGNLVKIPFRSGEFSASIGGTGSVVIQGAGYLYNEDGSGTFAQITAGTGLGNSAGAKWNFTGKILGVRWYRQKSTVPAFCVVIDGVAYAVNASNSTYHNTAYPGVTSDLECCYIVVDDLPDTNADGSPMIHSAFMVVPSQGVNAAAAVSAFGYLVEQRVGYSEKPRVLIPVTGTVPTSLGAITTGPGTDQAIRGARKVMYSNGDSSPRVVTLQMSVNGNAAVTVKKIYLGATGAAGDSAEVDFGDRMLCGNDFKHVVDSGSLVTYAAMGAY